MSSSISNLKPAILKCYSDASCSKELDKDGAIYRIVLGTKEGFNGTDGDQVSQYIYIKNCGDTNATDTYIKEVGDNANCFKISVRNIILADIVANIGTIVPNEVVPVKISSYIPKESEAIESFLNYTILYESVPPFDTNYYKDTVTPDKIQLKFSKKSSTGKIEEEYTIKNIDKLFNDRDFISKLNITPEMRTPVKIYHGTTDEIYWDNTLKKYKVRLKCPNCESWTNWENLNTFDYSAEIICTKCAHSIKVANTINLAEEPEYIDILTKCKLPIKEDTWTKKDNSDTYFIRIENVKSAVSINAYKKANNKFEKVLVNILVKDGCIILESLAPFTGYILLLEEEAVDIDNIKPKFGMAYGKGIYGHPLYGQESFIHISDSIEIDIPIKGQDSVMIGADFKILTKYTGLEANIEDIQSYYTDRYMRLGCYDGPALPLKLN